MEKAKAKVKEVKTAAKIAKVKVKMAKVRAKARVSQSVIAALATSLAAPYTRNAKQGQQLNHPQPEAKSQPQQPSGGQIGTGGKTKKNVLCKYVKDKNLGRCPDKKCPYEHSIKKWEA